MPIYAYKCASCGFAKDVLQKLSDSPLSDCPSCGEASFLKQLTAAGFQLKGSGWYATDFKNGNAGAPAAADEKAGGSGESGADAKTADKGDAKAAAKSDGKGDGKGDSKGSAKPDAKSDSKAEVKSEPKKADTPAAKKPDAAPAAGSGA